MFDTIMKIIFLVIAGGVALMAITVGIYGVTISIIDIKDEMKRREKAQGKRRIDG